MIRKLVNHRGVKLSSTLGGQRELIREMRNKINEIIDATPDNSVECKCVCHNLTAIVNGCIHCKPPKSKGHKHDYQEGRIYPKGGGHYKGELCIKCGEPKPCEICGQVNCKPVSPKAPKGDWEDAFEALWDENFETGASIRYFYQYKKVKQFIAEVLKEAREEEFENGYNARCLAEDEEAIGVSKETKAKQSNVTVNVALDVYRGKLIKKIEKLKLRHITNSKYPQSKEDEQWQIDTQREIDWLNKKLDEVIKIIYESI